MRIQHNIMAMSAYRNYNTNTSAVAKNLEKLSSGYKINRAGDDAAGLAISEKMRAQITGLNAAQKNVKDGISLVKTAEGAMQEIQDMLNRMDYLATQSANGTYQDEVDREALQKEVNQLCDEINRIADSANFNGIKLLDGSLDSVDKVTVNDPTFKGMSKITGMKDRFNKDMSSTNAAYDQAIADNLASADKNTGGWVKDFRHKDAVDAGKTSFKYSAQNGQWTVKEGQVKVQLELYGTQNGTPNDEMAVKLDATIDVAEDGVLTAADAMQKLYDSITPNAEGKKTILLSMSDKAAALPGNDDAKIEYEVTMENGEMKFTMTDKGYATACQRSADSNDVSQFTGNFNVVLTAWQTAAGAAGNAGTADGVTTGTPADKLSASGLNDCATNEINVGRPNAVAQLAEVVVSVTGNGAGGGTIDIKDGAGFKVGDEYYVWGGSDATVNGKYGDNVKVVDIRDLCDSDGKLKTNLANGALTGATNEALSRLSAVAGGNKTWSVEVSQNGDALVFTEKADNPSSADLTTIEGIQASLQMFTGIEANVDTQVAKGKALQLQIGDTSEEFNQLKVSIGDMHTKALGIDGLNIGNAESASKAIATIKNAINQVSSVRGDLGAYQNRLEHTANNLSVMAENITDAESSIRDTDIAEEMMAYTKNNILVQSAQAMLAQANQVPQGVLQLLG